MTEQDNQIPAQVEHSVNAFVGAAKDAFESDLVSVVLFGSAAEGKLRATSDVNIPLVLKRFEQPRADRLREPLYIARYSDRSMVLSNNVPQN